MGVLKNLLSHYANPKLFSYLYVFSDSYLPEEKLQTTLEYYPVHYVYYKNLKIEEIKAALFEASNSSFEEYASLIVIITMKLSPKDRDEIVQYFMGKNCYDLIKKPKLFFFETEDLWKKSIKTIKNMPDIYAKNDAPPESDIFICNSDDIKFLWNLVSEIRPREEIPLTDLLLSACKKRGARMTLVSTLTRHILIDDLMLKYTPETLENQHVFKKNDHHNVKRGSMIIFNYTLYNDGNYTNLKERRGAHLDSKNLINTFENLNFETHAYENMAKLAVMEKLNEFLRLNENESDCIVLVLYTVVSGGKYFTTTEPLSFQEIMDSFKKYCYTDKLKIILTQNERTFDEEDSYPKIEKLDPETLICYSCCEGGVSIRNFQIGSFFISEFCKTIQEFPWNIINLQSLISETANKTAKAQVRVGEMCLKQMPVFVSTLTKNYFFERKF